jgi:hypothetical protein
MIQIAILLVLLGVPVSSLADAPQPLSECGQTLEGNHYLTQDLDCSGVDGHGVFLVTHGARLELRGFSIQNVEPGFGAVLCSGTCRVIGPGALSSVVWVGGIKSSTARISNVTITGSPHAAVIAENVPGSARVIIRDSVINGNFRGIRADRRVRLLDTVVSDNSTYGISVRCNRGSYKLKGSAVESNSPDFTCH